MRVVIGCLAAIGLIVVLLVAGCVGLIGFGIAKATNIPPYATHAEISRQHASDLAVIREAITRRQFDGLAQRVSTEVLAIYHDRDDVLRRHPLSNKSYMVVNHAGTGSLTANGRTVECVVIELSGEADRDKDDYLVFFLDKQAQAVERR